MKRLGCVLVILVSTYGAPTLAQQTTLYGYDAHGRLRTSGSNSANTTAYVVDNAENRGSRRCCNAVGSWQVTEDGFDPYFYLQTYPDILAAGVDPYHHWTHWGASENRWPNRYFDTAWYRATYNVPQGANPLTDYHTGGWQAGRNPSPEFSTTGYHANYPDTGSVDPLQHYLRWGHGEGRSIFPVP